MARFTRVLPAPMVALTAAAAICAGWGASPVAASAAARPGSRAAPAATATRLVRYLGYVLRVPVSWPVYRLSSDPSVCVRFDRHAVYLGFPSPTQRCPAHAAGRTEAILVTPLAGHAAASGAGGGGLPLAPVTVPGAQGSDGASAEITAPARGIAITATWGTHPGVVERALHVGWRTLARGAGLAGGGSAARAAGGFGAPVSPLARAVRARTATAGGTVYTGLGFDACSAPSPSQMSAWESASPYHATGIYIGGTNMACAQPNLTAAWVSVEAAAGWYLIPTYVGLQSPTSACGCATINPKQAAPEGTAAAVDAVTQAQAVGLGPGTPIYFDMEAYTPTTKSTNAVLTFLGAWTAQLHADGYSSGVYSSGASGIADLVKASGTSFLEPDDIWIADWNGAETTSDPYVPAPYFANHQRLHQYSGGHNETYAGVTINIDSDYLDGQTASAFTPPPDGTYVEEAGVAPVYVLAGGAPLYVDSWSAVGGPQPVTILSAQQFALLRPVPADGTFLVTSTGEVYRVAGGAPLLVSNWNVFGGAQPYISIDEWDIDNITNPLAHLRPVPANGTFLTTPSGSIYRVAGGTPFPIASWTPYGGVQPSVTIDPWDIQNVGSTPSHLLAAPVDGTAVEGIPSDTYWMFKGGRRAQLGVLRGAVKVDDSGLAAFPIIPTCVVPKLRHMTLGQARRALRRAHCKLGKVVRPHGESSHVLRVASQWPLARSKHLPGWPVKVTLR